MSARSSFILIVSLLSLNAFCADVALADTAHSVDSGSTSEGEDSSYSDTRGVLLDRLNEVARARQEAKANYKRNMERIQKGPPNGRDSLMKQEILRHKAELKRLSMTSSQLRKQNIEKLKTDWRRVESDWKVETTMHDARMEKIKRMPDGDAKLQARNKELTRHRASSKKIAVQRHKVHKGVMRQANQDVLGSTANTSSRMKQTAGTKISDPAHRGMMGDLDAGAGYRTTQKAEKILQEMGVKGPGGKKVTMKAGVLETSPEFGMTVNASPGPDRVGSSGHQSQVKQGATHGETYVSETGGLRSKALKDHVSTLDHSKKAMKGIKQKPSSLVGKPKGQEMVKGALKAAKQANLDPEMVQSMARQRGIKNPDNILDDMAAIKTGRATIANADEAAKLQKVSQDILNAAQAKTKAGAMEHIRATEGKISDLRAKGKHLQAEKLHTEVADYRAKARATEKHLAAQEGTTSSTGKKTKSSSKKSSSKQPAGGKFMKVAGWALGAYGIYEGYNTATAEMAKKKEAEPKGWLGWGKNKAELAGRTLWHGLGFGAAHEMGAKAGREALEEYNKGISDGTIDPNSISDYFKMKASAVGWGLAGFAKGMTYDAIQQSGTSFGHAVKEGVGIGKDSYEWLTKARSETATNEERAKIIHDKLIAKGASPVGAKRAADRVREGDYMEARRLSRILAAKRAAEMEALEPDPKPTTYKERKRRRLARQRRKEKEELAREKQSQVGKMPTESEEDTDNKLRNQIVSILKTRGMPANDALIDHLTRILEKEGMKGVESSLAEVKAMQGSFSGPVTGGGTLRLNVRGHTVSGTFTGPAIVRGPVRTTTSGVVKGMIDTLSRQIHLTMTVKVNVSGARGAVPRTMTSTSRLSGKFTGKGYSGSIGNGSWSVSRSTR